MKKSNYMVTIVQDNICIDRRVWINEQGKEVVKINGTCFELDWCYTHYDEVDKWAE